MKNTKVAKQLESSVGATVSQVFVEVSFFNTESQGEINAICIEFADDRFFSLGCAGNGSIFVNKSKCGSIGTIPGQTIECRPILHLSDCTLKAIEIGDTDIRLNLCKYLIQIINNDDELEVIIDGQSLDKKMIIRNS